MTHPAPLRDGPALQTLRQAVAVMDQAEACGKPAVLAQAALGVACCYRELGAADAAEAVLHRALAAARAAQSADATVEVLCELIDLGAQQVQAREGDDAGDEPEGARIGDAATARHHAQRRERLREQVLEAAALAARSSDPEWTPKVLLHASDVLNRLGEHAEAAQLQTQAVRLMAGAPATEPAEAALLPGPGRLADS